MKRPIISTHQRAIIHSESGEHEELKLHLRILHFKRAVGNTTIVKGFKNIIRKDHNQF